MCAIAGVLRLGDGERIPNPEERIEAMLSLQAHRGPSGKGAWRHPAGRLALGHHRLSVIDLSERGRQPMLDDGGNAITYNGEIYNYIELRETLGPENFRSGSDTEVILHAYRKWGPGCVEHLRGMFAFALWDEEEGSLFCARDRFGIKPFYYAMAGDCLYFASECKALLPFLQEIRPDSEALHEYLTFQFYLGGKTLFEGISELPMAHTLTARNASVETRRYWNVTYEPEFGRPASEFHGRLHELLFDSVGVHTRADVPVGAYLSGGVDSSIVTSVACRSGHRGGMMAFTGKFAGERYDESRYARDVAKECAIPLEEIEIGSSDFVDSVRKVIYHLDYPLAGPGSFPQFHVARLASQHRRVVLGGQGGDEIFGGYARYLIAYFEQCIKGAIDGTLHDGNFIVTYESIIPNLATLRTYKPLLQEFWREGLFDDLDRRYFRLINRAPTLGEEIRWGDLGASASYETFRDLFCADNVRHDSYFDLMTHFDFKTLLPALLHVEDRMSMAHGLESRVPFLDHALIEFAATMPSDVKFKDGRLKRVLVEAMRDVLPESVAGRQDKMGFPVPLNDWLQQPGVVRDFVQDLFRAQAARERPVFNTPAILEALDHETTFGRKIWGLMSLELWFQEFADRHAEFKSRLRPVGSGAN